MKKILALIMALAMVFCLAACGGNGDKDETTTAPAGETVANAEGTEAAPVDGTEAASGDTTDVSGDASTEASTEADASENDPANDAPATGDLTKAQFVALLNAETAKIAKSGSYSLNRNCTYIRNLDVGKNTERLNDLIKTIDDKSDLNSVVGGFLGIGTKTAVLPKDKANVDSDYIIKATSLKESDLATFSGSNGVYKFTLADAKNPKKTGATPFSRFTNDFITHEEVVTSIAEFTPLIKVSSSTVNYTKIQGEVTVKDGKITNISYSYTFDAALTLKLVVTINGNGAAKTTNTYSNIKY